MVFQRIRWTKGNPYLILVESYRENGKPKQRFLRHLGRVNLGAKITELRRAIATSEYQEKEMQKRADWNQEGQKEFYEKAAQTEREELKRLKRKLQSYERHYKKLGTTITDEKFLEITKQEYEKSNKLGDVVHIPELTQRIQEETGLSKEDIHKRLYGAYIEKKIDLQPGKGKDSLQSPDDKHTFQYMQLRGKLGTTESKIKYYYDAINEEKRGGGTVRIPDLYHQIRKEGVSEKELREELLRLEKERVIDLQTASDTKFIKGKDREGGFYIKGGKIYDLDDLPPNQTRRGYIQYIVWRRKEGKKLGTATSRKRKKKAKRKYDQYECGLCGKQFQNKQTLSWHLEDDHHYVGEMAKKNIIEIEPWG